jgi:prevent-host-death family protein
LRGIEGVAIMTIDMTMVTEDGMETIKASEFKAKCLALMDEVARTGEPLLITKNGKPVAELRPPTQRRRQTPFGWHKGLVEIRGDIVAPLDEPWESLE